jgi:hypothetical protein
MSVQKDDLTVDRTLVNNSIVFGVHDIEHRLEGVPEGLEKW